MSLIGKSIVVTRDPNQAKPFVKQLRNLGAEVFQFPTIKITGIDDRKKILDFIGDIHDYDWIIFTSTNAVKYFFRLIKKRPETIQMIKIACIGNKTASLLTDFNLKPALTPKKHSTQDLLIALQKCELRGKRVLIPVSNLARHDLEHGLHAFGARVQRIEVYKNVPYNNPKKRILYQRICADLVDCITFFSPSAIDFFIDLMGKDVVTVVNSKRIALAVIGPTTAQAAHERGLKPAILPEKSESHSLILALEQYYASNKSPLRKGG